MTKKLVWYKVDLKNPSEPPKRVLLTSAETSFYRQTGEYFADRSSAMLALKLAKIVRNKSKQLFKDLDGVLA